MDWVLGRVSWFYKIFLKIHIFIPTNSRFQLSNTLFEELVMDVFDEVDRRENENSK